MTNQTPETYEQLIQVSETYRPQIVRLAKGQRWCWITEWMSKERRFKFGAKVEAAASRATWHRYKNENEAFMFAAPRPGRIISPPEERRPFDSPVGISIESEPRLA
ncbi:MAG: hypothetical protein WCK17_17850 [Verrucomicrobiota bacterium]